MNETYLWLTVAVIALVTALIRFLPVWIFGNGRKTPPLIEKMGRLRPGAVMGLLVVDCLQDVTFPSLSGFLPALIASVLVCALHVWKRNTLLSIACGTVCYMLLVQVVF